MRVVTCRNRVDLPPIFGPVSSMMEDLALMPRVMLLGMTCLPGCGCIMGCRICLPFIEAPLTSPSSRNSGLHAPVICGEDMLVSIWEINLQGIQRM